MGQTHSVDDLLVRVQNESTDDNYREPEVAAVDQPDAAGAVEQPEVAAEEDKPVPEGHDPDVSEAKAEESSAEDDKPASDPVAGSSQPIDEYGNPVEKPKTYTEEEVQRMIRERLARGRHAEQPTQQQVQQAASDGFQADPNSDETWEAQLEQFIEKTIDKRQQKQTEKEWRAQEAAKQAEFESKFSTGMNKYQDFHQVVQGKPITDSMMMATRNLENPAAFIYAACKIHPGEIERISRIPDSASQAMEIGRLDAAMRKQSSQVSSAAKPIPMVKGDMPVKQMEQPSLEYRIQQHAKQKFARK
jgi:hypothetical protein